MTNKPNAEELLNKYREGICTEEEKAIVESWHLHQLADKQYTPTHAELLKADEELRNKLSLPNNSAKVRRLWPRIFVAASTLLMLSICGYVLTTKHKPQPVPVAQTQVITEPRRATLTLANGASIVLDNAKAGLLAKQGNVAVKQNTKGELVYSTSAPVLASEALLYNTITTKKGADYDLVLADGTKVWLNSSSSLSFPAGFTGNERNVKLTGEAYFEVAKNKEKPFTVDANGTRIRVLGTHFNIGAYADEPAVVATLLEGSVKVIKNNNEVLIVPGQQATSWLNNNNINVATANMDEVMAWRNGYFKFYNEDIKSIFRKVSRWYDMDVEYRGNVNGQRFGGTFSRSKNITELLAHIEKLGTIRFKIEGRRIIVMA